MSEMDFDQSISDSGVKSWRGMRRQVMGGLCCVVLRTPSKARENLVLTYLRAALASSNVIKRPIDINVCVKPTLGSPITGEDRGSPNAPEPFDAGIMTL